jgi:hypothetical protein
MPGEEVQISLKSSLDMIKKVYENKLKQDELKQLLECITQIKTKDPLDKRREVVQLDVFLSILL